MLTVSHGHPNIRRAVNELLEDRRCKGEQIQMADIVVLPQARLQERVREASHGLVDDGPTVTVDELLGMLRVARYKGVGNPQAYSLGNRQLIGLHRGGTLSLERVHQTGGRADRRGHPVEDATPLVDRELAMIGFEHDVGTDGRPGRRVQIAATPSRWSIGASRERRSPISWWSP